MDSDGLTTTPFCPSRQNQSTASTQLTNNQMFLLFMFFSLQNVLVVEDIVDTGNTITKLLRLLKKVNPKTIKVAR